MYISPGHEDILYLKKNIKYVIVQYFWGKDTILRAENCQNPQPMERSSLLYVF